MINLSEDEKYEILQLTKQYRESQLELQIITENIEKEKSKFDSIKKNLDILKEKEQDVLNKLQIKYNHVFTANDFIEIFYE